MNWNDVFGYDPETGLLSWRVRPRNHFKTEHGWKSCNGRNANNPPGIEHHQRDGRKAGIRTCVDGRRLYAHRIIWEMMNGSVPDGMVVDHIDGDPFNNRLSNLRLATHADNSHNRKIRKDSPCSAGGVYPVRGKFRAVITTNYKKRHLGYFKTIEEAIDARASAEQEQWGQYARRA